MKNKSASPRKVAWEVTRKLGFSDWNDDLITREIGTATSLNEAAERILNIMDDASTALLVIVRELNRSLKNRGEK